jgi:hypothetical protein
MQLLGIAPGPAVGQALEALEEEVEAGEVPDVAAARAFLLERRRREDAAEDAGATDTAASGKGS